MRVFKQDMVVLDTDGDSIVWRVQKLDLGKGLSLVPHNEANTAARINAKTLRFKTIRSSGLINAKARRVYVDEIGNMRDPGPPV